jgi:hypothetical protein
MDSLESLKSIKVQKLTDELGIQFGISEVQNAQLIQKGFWYIRFFANLFPYLEDLSEWLGIRVLPEKNWLDCPVVMVSKYGGAVTVSPNLKELLVNLILYTQIEPGNIECLSQAWSSIREDILRIHIDLGGSPSSFSRLDKYVTNVENFKTEIYSYQNTRAYDFLQVDESAETKNFREYLNALMSDEGVIELPPGNLGAWQDYAKSAIAARAYTLFSYDKASAVETSDLIWLGFNKAAPFDSDMPVFQPLWQFTLARNPASFIRNLAFALVKMQDPTHLPEHIQTNPLFPAARALANVDHPTSYRGVEHMEAAQKFDEELNDGQRSYEALISASFWSAMSFGFPYKESYEAALMLAQKYGWDEMGELLEQNAFELQQS